MAKCTSDDYVRVDEYIRTPSGRTPKNRYMVYDCRNMKPLSGIRGQSRKEALQIAENIRRRNKVEAGKGRGKTVKYKECYDDYYGGKVIRSDDGSGRYGMVWGNLQELKNASKIGTKFKKVKSGGKC